MFQMYGVEKENGLEKKLFKTFKKRRRVSSDDEIWVETKRGMHQQVIVNHVDTWFEGIICTDQQDEEEKVQKPKTKKGIRQTIETITLARLLFTDNFKKPIEKEKSIKQKKKRWLHKVSHVETM